MTGKFEKYRIPETTALQRVDIGIEFLEPPFALRRERILLRAGLLRCGKQNQVTAYKGYSNTYFFRQLQ